MRLRRPAFLGRAFGALSILAALAIIPIGCGDNAAKTSAPAQINPEVQKANENMENFMMKNQQKK